MPRRAKIALLLAAYAAGISAIAYLTGVYGWLGGVPQDFRITEISAGDATSYADISTIRDDFHARSTPLPIYLQVSLTSRADLRAMVFNERWTRSEFNVVRCSCDERKMARAHQTCSREITPLFDPSGWINIYDRFSVSSRTSPDEKGIAYRIYVLMVPEDPGYDSVDLVRAPADLCIRFKRKHMFLPERVSPEMRISKAEIVAAIKRGHPYGDSNKDCVDKGPYADEPTGQEPLLKNPLREGCKRSF